METTKTETIKIRDNSGKLCTVGYIRNGTFFKRVKKSKHYFRASNSWGIDAEVFNKIIFTECRWIKILDEDENTLYECSPGDYKEKGSYIHFKPHRAQVLLSVFNFSKTFDYHKK